jgi:hypothetical protein
LSFEAVQPDALTDGERALRELVANLNIIHHEHGLIDTLYRDQVRDAFHDLAGRLDIPEARLYCSASGGSASRARCGR